MFLHHISDGCAGAVKRILGKIEGRLFQVMKVSYQPPYRYNLSLSFTYPGVTDIEANVEAKTVVVTHSDAVTKVEMLEKLQKVSR